MNILREDPIKMQPRKALRATERLETLLQGQDAVLEDILRLVPGKRALFAGQYQGRAAIFRLALNERERHSQRAAMTELSRVRSYMASGPYRVPELYDLLHEGTVTVTQHITGITLQKYLWALPVEKRPLGLPKTASWLWTYTSPTMARRQVNHRPWRNRVDEALRRQPHPGLRRSEARLTQKLHALARSLDRNATWRVARTHGDYHPGNMMQTQDGTIWGVDLSPAEAAPIYRDMARMMVHLARRGMDLSGRTLFGVDAAAFDSFRRVFAMDEAETWGHLPFFICHEALVRVEHPRLPQRRINQARRMTDALFDDMRILLKQGPEALRDRLP